MCLTEVKVAARLVPKQHLVYKNVTLQVSALVVSDCSVKLDLVQCNIYLTMMRRCHCL